MLLLLPLLKTTWLSYITCPAFSTRFIVLLLAYVYIVSYVLFIFTWSVCHLSLHFVSKVTTWCHFFTKYPRRIKSIFSHSCSPQKISVFWLRTIFFTFCLLLLVFVLIFYPQCKHADSLSPAMYLQCYRHAIHRSSENWTTRAARRSCAQHRTYRSILSTQRRIHES